MSSTAMTVALVLGLTAFAAFAAFAAANNYCGVCPDHTMCKYTTAAAGSGCTNYKWTALNAASKAAAVKAHNDLRNKVALGQETRGTKAQPAASNMRKMVWDDELGAIAQRWANQCTFAHDTCRNTLDKTYTGQNIFWEASTGPLGSVDWTKAVEDWYNEVKDRDGSLNTVAYKSTSGPVVGHYTQLVWANSYQVGCGYADYTARKNGRDWASRLVVCNYKPGGNFLGQSMYQSGGPASECPAGTKKDFTYPGLCA